MFRQNHKHLQVPMFSTVASLPEAQRKLLEKSWAGVFYREHFMRIDERPFAVLFSDEASRPNVPVNRLVAFDVLKAGFGWSDEEMYEAFLFNVQVRYALGLYDLGDDSFDLRTLYYFRRRLSDHMQNTGENLIEKAFAQITDEQIKAFQVKTGRLRMDSTFISSNICHVSRLHLLVEMLQRVQRMLTEADKQRYAPDFAPYVLGTAGQFMYRLHGQDIAPHIEQVGIFMARLVVELRPSYHENDTYLLLERVFLEHFELDQPRLRVKSGAELNSRTLNSPDDPDATYRNKGGEGHLGYVSNVTETCDPENKLQLIVAMQTEKNVTDDGALLAAVLPSLKERTGVEELTTDGGYMGDIPRQATAAQNVQHILTSLRGAQPGSIALGIFAINDGADGLPEQITCPFEQTAPFTRTRSNRYRAAFDAQVCATCPRAEHCRARPRKRSPAYVLVLSLRQIQSAQQQHAFLLRKKDHPKNLRVAIEGTISALKRPFADGQLPVRGRVRVAAMMVATAAMANVRRIDRHLRSQAAEARRKAASTAPDTTASSLASSFLRYLGRLFAVHFSLPAQLMVRN